MATVSDTDELAAAGETTGPGRRRRLRAGLAAALSLAGGLAASAALAETQERSAHLSLYGAKWVHDNLIGIGVQAARRQLDFRDQYFASVTYSQVLIRDLPLLGPLRDSSLELEGQLGRHFNTMTHAEATAAIVWRSPDATLGSTSINFAVGKGLSYAFGTPHKEGVRRDREVQRLLSYLAFELELSHAALPNLSLVPRFLGKERAVRHVIDAHLGPGPVLTIGVGDSFSDAAFLGVCDHAVVPRGSQLAGLLRLAEGRI